MAILKIDRDKILKYKQNVIEDTILRGIIGIKQSDGTYSATLRSDNLVPVTLDDGTVHYANLGDVANIGGAEVDITKRGNNLIIERGSTRGTPTKRNVDNASTTVRGSGKESPIDTLLIIEGLVRQQSGSLYVQVLPLTYENVAGGLSRKDTTSQIDLSGSVPGSSSQRRWVIVVLDSSDGSVSTVNGTTVTRALNMSDLATASLLVKQHEIPLSAIDLRNGDTSIPWQRIYEGRLFAPRLMLPTKTTVTSATYTLSLWDSEVFVNYAGAVTLTLPAASDMQYARDIVIKDISGAASGNNITINRAGSDTIDGATSMVINTDYGSTRLASVSSTTWGAIVGTSSGSAGGQAIATKTTNYTITSSDNTILIDASIGAVTITLPDATGATGKVFNIKAMDITNTTTLNTTSSQTIDNVTSIVYSSQYENYTVQSDGSNWVIL